MAPSTPRRRTKQLLKELWELQTHDVPMTPATLYEVRYLLRSSKRSTCIEIETPKPRSNVIDPTPFTLVEGAVPKFILCQLLDQKLIQSRNYQDTIALPAVLSVLSLLFSTEASSTQLTHPTQFRWHCSRTHRSHVIFAYLDIKMKTKVYSVEELLSLKNSASPEIIAAVACRDNDLAEMLRHSSRVSSRSYNSNSNSFKRGTKKMLDDSSSTSDEVVFRGTMSRRSLKTEAAQFAQVTNPTQLAQPPQHPQNAWTVPNTTGNPKTDSAVASASNQPTEWKYRGRSGSEVTHNEPVSAPTGLVAQQNEGFQRFYKAVVSPTHVRVTAGGRIVPNTRNPVSPTAKHTKDDDSTTNGHHQPEPVPAPAPASAAAPKPFMPVMGMPHPMPFYYPGYASMPPIHPMSGMPMPMVPPGFPYPMPMPNMAAPVNTQDLSNKENQTKKTDDGVDKSATAGAQPTKTGVELSPPEQFDHSKPFMYNGQQWIFPMYPTPYPGYMGMPPPGYPGPPVPGAPMMMPPSMAMPPMMGPMRPMAAQPPPGAAIPAPSVTASARHATPQPPSKPPISSIRPSQITRKQIDGLRSNLKYHEDQLQYNKHQIDEKDMENKIEMLLADIERFERVFKAQADYEEKHYPKSAKVKDDVSSSGDRSSAPSTKTSQSQSEESKESKATVTTINSRPSLRKQERSRDSVGVNSNKSSTASYNFDEPGQERLMNILNPGRGSKLPSGAALAPVFQPRSVSALTEHITNGQSRNWQSAQDGDEITQEQLEATEKRLLTAGNKARSLSQQVQDSTYSESRGHSPRGHEYLGAPYLVGTLPHGANAYSTHRMEYEYNRKLTDQEVQARHLYWGKAPRSVSQGLPKYDGRNFYPPSPVKNMTPSASPSIRRSHIPIGVPEIDYEFHGPRGKDVDPFHAMSPFRAKTPSDAFLKPEEPESRSKTPSVKSSQSFNSQAEDHSAEFEKALAESESVEVETEGSHSKGASETRSADYVDTRANVTGSKVWQNVLKRGLTSSDVLPSTVSSTTVRGYLPQFSGHVAAALSPTTISGTIGSPNRGSPSKDNEINSNGTSTFMKQKIAEICPPATGERLSDTLLSMVGMKAPAWAN